MPKATLFNSTALPRGNQQTAQTKAGTTLAIIVLRDAAQNGHPISPAVAAALADVFRGANDRQPPPIDPDDDPGVSTGELAALLRITRDQAHHAVAVREKGGTWHGVDIPGLLLRREPLGTGSLTRHFIRQSSIPSGAMRSILPSLIRQLPPREVENATPAAGVH